MSVTREYDSESDEWMWQMSVTNECDKRVWQWEWWMNVTNECDNWVSWMSVTNECDKWVWQVRVLPFYDLIGVRKSCTIWQFVISPSKQSLLFLALSAINIAPNLSKSVCSVFQSFLSINLLYLSIFLLFIASCHSARPCYIRTCQVGGPEEATILGSLLHWCHNAMTLAGSNVLIVCSGICEN